MPSKLRDWLGEALGQVSSYYANLAVHPATEIEQYQTPFLHDYRIYCLTYFHPNKPIVFYVGAAPVVGRVNGSILTEVANLAERHASGRVRLTVEQKLVILDVPEDQVDDLIAGLEPLGLQVNSSTFRRGTMACTGIEFCKLAIVETKGRGGELVAELEKRLPTFEHPLTINVNGCPNSCARFQIADIGLKGSLMTNSDGDTVEGFQVHLGGSLGEAAGFGR